MTERPLIRTVHHLSSTGGTVMSRAIAGLPRVVLLSELNPSAPQRFLPNDPTAHLLENYAHLAPELSPEGVFLRRVDEVYAIAERAGHALVIRDHSHGDFLVRRPRPPRLNAVLSQRYDLASVVTVRDPVDAWLSMKASGFARLRSFADYLARIDAFLAHYAGVPGVRYEDFVADPRAAVKTIAAALRLPYEDDFRERMKTIRLSGDSGRVKANLGAPIQSLARREIDAELAAELADPAVAARLARLNYPYVAP